MKVTTQPTIKRPVAESIQPSQPSSSDSKIELNHNTDQEPGPSIKFDEMPQEVLMQIGKNLSPTDQIKLSHVNHSFMRTMHDPMILQHNQNIRPQTIQRQNPNLQGYFTQPIKRFYWSPEQRVQLEQMAANRIKQARIDTNLQQGHYHQVNVGSPIAYEHIKSPSGRYVVNFQSSILSIHDTQYRPFRTYEFYVFTDQMSTNFYHFSANEQFFISINVLHEQRYIQVIQLHKEQPEIVFHTAYEGDSLPHIDFSPDNRFMAIQYASEELMVSDFQFAPSQISHLSGQSFIHEPIHGSNFFPDSHHLITQNHLGQLLLYDLNQTPLQAILLPMTNLLNTKVLGPLHDQSICLFSQDNHQMTRYHYQDNKITQIENFQYKHPVECMGISSDQHWMVISPKKDDHHILYHIAANTPICQSLLNLGTVDGHAFSPDNKILAVLHRHPHQICPQISLYDLTTSPPTYRQVTHQQFPSKDQYTMDRFFFSSDSQTLLCTFKHQPLIHLLHLENSTNRWSTISGFPGTPVQTTFSPQGTWLVTQTVKNISAQNIPDGFEYYFSYPISTLQVWNMRTNPPQSSHIGDWRVCDVQFNTDGDQLLIQARTQEYGPETQYYSLNFSIPFE